MALYKVSTAKKKNVFIRTFYTARNGPAVGKVFQTEEWYRWGSCTVEVDEGDDPPTVNEEHYENPFLLEDWMIVDQEQDDGVTFQMQFGDDWTEEEKEYIEQLWDNGDFWDNVEIDDMWTEYYGPLDIEKIE